MRDREFVCMRECVEGWVGEGICVRRCVLCCVLCVCVLCMCLCVCLDELLRVVVEGFNPKVRE